MAASRMAELALLIATNTANIDTHLASKGLPTPSFDANQPAHLLNDTELAAARRAVLEATDELHALMLGPIGILTSPPHNFMISLQAIYRFGLATGFPIGKDEATFGEIAASSGVCESQVRRILRHAMAFRIFCEPRKGVVAHTAASKVLAENTLMREWIGMVSEEMWPAASRTVEALVRWPGSEEPNQSVRNLSVRAATQRY
ncbi:hypothetical protein ABVK25_000477 [Lepraria finkii]|uniref:Uncharacterized protein n=1 Tax=Lepraria finkii TaxID=1340010 RepID=A0ABR4BN02_9LECA